MNCKVQRWTSLGVQLHWDFISIHLCRGSLQKIKRHFCLQSKSALHRYIFINALLNERKYCCRGALALLLWSLISQWRWGGGRGDVQCSSGLRYINKPQCLTGGCCLWPKSDSTPGFHLPGGEVLGSLLRPDGSKRRESIALLRSLTHAAVSVAVRPMRGWAWQQVLSNCICCQRDRMEYAIWLLLSSPAVLLLIIYNHLINNNFFFRSFFQIFVFDSEFQGPSSQ